MPGSVPARAPAGRRGGEDRPQPVAGGLEARGGDSRHLSSPTKLKLIAGVDLTPTFGRTDQGGRKPERKHREQLSIMPGPGGMWVLHTLNMTA